VQQLLRNPQELEQLKRSTRDHALQNWHADRAAADLLELYDAWRNGKADSPYQRKMIEQADQFGESYRRRMIHIMSDGGIDRLKWHAALTAMESWNTFRLGRTLKRATDRLRGTAVADESGRWY
jgi:hypothetical protein